MDTFVERNELIGLEDYIAWTTWKRNSSYTLGKGLPSGCLIHSERLVARFIRPGNYV